MEERHRKSLHLDVRYLWVQQRLNEKLLHIEKVKGAVNLAHILTKYCNASEVAENCTFIGVNFGYSRDVNVCLFNLRKREFQATRTRTRWPRSTAVWQRSAREAPRAAADAAMPKRVRWADIMDEEIIDVWFGVE